MEKAVETYQLAHGKMDGPDDAFDKQLVERAKSVAKSSQVTMFEVHLVQAFAFKGKDRIDRLVYFSREHANVSKKLVQPRLWQQCQLDLKAATGQTKFSGAALTPING